MTANELRLGNIIANGKEAGWGARDGYAVVESIQEDRINEWHDMGASGSLSISKVKPMPLTVEWLIKFGFEWDGIKNTHLGIGLYDTKRLYFYFEDGVINQTQITEEGSFENLGHIAFKPIEYVHQLQNLYFSLTGQELLIQP